MNKRDFIVQGGGALLGSASLGPVWAAAPKFSPAISTTDPASTQAAWEALQGQPFTGQTALGRAVTLTVQDVSGMNDMAASKAATSLEQFTVSFHGPRALPLKTGLHQLTHPQTGPVQLYLEATHQGEHVHYDAHFSLLS